MGLAGLGDLVLTCTDDHSRNRRFGLALGPGRRRRGRRWARSARSSRVTTPRGAAVGVALREQVVMPIAEGIYGVLYEQAARRARWCAD